MSPQRTAALTDFDAVTDVLGTNERFLVVTHENPDGDALGSMLGATLGLRALGKDALMYLAVPAPLPAEYGFMPLGEVLREPPDDVEERVLLALDCANSGASVPTRRCSAAPPSSSTSTTTTTTRASGRST